MATRNYVIPGIDPTTIVGGISKAQLLQMLRECAPETDIGWVIISEATPDPVTNTEIETFLWLKPSTAEVRFWTGTSWQLISSSPTLANGSVHIFKLSTEDGDPLQLIRINVGGDSFEFVDAADIFPDGSIPLAKLEDVTDGDFLLADGGAQLAPTNFEAKFVELLTFSEISIEQLRDLSSTGLVNQVLSLVAPGGSLTFSYADALIRDATITPAKLKFPSGSAGFYTKVNATLNGFDYVNPTALATTIKAALVYNSYSAGTAGQAVAANTTATIELTAELDPDALVSLAANQFTLIPGTYIFELTTQSSAASPKQNQLQLYNVDTTTVVANRSWLCDTQGGSVTSATLSAGPITVTGTGDDTFEFRLVSGNDGVAQTLGLAVSLGGLGEVYSQVKIIKLS